MSKRGLNIARADPPSINTVLLLVDDATQYLSDRGLLPDSAVNFALRASNLVFIGPPTSSPSKAVPSWRLLVAADIPSITTSKLSDYTPWTDFTSSLVFTPSAGTFTGYTVTTARYMKIAKSLYIQLFVSGGTLSGTPQHIDMTLPAGLIAAATSYYATNIRNGTVYQFGSAYVINGTTVLGFTVAAEATGTWTTGVGQDIAFVGCIETTT